MAVDGDARAEDWSLNEVAGFVFRCYLQSAGHMTDYIVDFGTVKLLGNGRHDQLVDLAVRAGLMTLVSGSGRRRVWRLLEDPEFVHVQLRAEVEWNRQRDRDRKNPSLTLPVRRRDGDACRWCGVVVSWTARRGGRSGTYDHLHPGQPATVETYAVCCGSCNSRRKADPFADEKQPIRPASLSPIYSRETLRLLLTMFRPDDLPSYTLLDPDTAAPAATRTSAPAALSGAIPGPVQPQALQDVPGSVEFPSSRQESSVETGATEAGSGRVGSGRARSGQARDGSARGRVGAEATHPTPNPGPPRRRGRRGGAGRA